MTTATMMPTARTETGTVTLKHFIGPIDPERVMLVRELQSTERSHRMALNEVIAYLLGQEHNDDPRGLNDTLACLSSGLNNRLGDIQRQRLKPLAWELAGTYCWRCTFTRMDLLTAMTARENLSRIWIQEGLRQEAETLRTWQGDITEAIPLLRETLRKMSGLGRQSTPAAICGNRMMRILEETARRPNFEIHPGEYPGEENSQADCNFGIAIMARGAMPEHKWTDLMISQVRKLVSICPHVDRSRTPRDRRYFPCWS